MDSIVVGWDGGGTKTSVICLDARGGERASGVFGSLNLNGASEADVRETVRDAVAFMRGQGTCERLVISAAGVSNPSVERFLREALLDAGYDGAVRIIGDQESALYGAVGEAGAVLVAGTGSICCGRALTGETTRSGGYGYLVGDEGSGYAIGRDIIAAVLRANDGRGEPTLLCDALAKRDKWRGVPAIMRSLYDPGFEKAHVAALAPLLLEVGADAVAARIAQKAADELTLLAVAVIDKLGLAESRLAFSGGILARYPMIRERVERSLTARYPRLQGFEPLADAAHGAALLALKWMREEQNNA